MGGNLTPLPSLHDALPVLIRKLASATRTELLAKVMLDESSAYSEFESKVNRFVPISKPPSYLLNQIRVEFLPRHRLNIENRCDS